MKDSLGMQVGHSSCHVLCDLDPHRPRELYGRVKQQVFETATVDVLQIKGEEKKRREGGREGGRGGVGQPWGWGVGREERREGGREGGRKGGREKVGRFQMSHLSFHTPHNIHKLISNTLEND